MSINGTTPHMNPELPCAVDTTGADRGIAVQVEGAILAYKEYGSRSILVGPESELRALLEGFGASGLPIAVHNATQTILMEESPVRAVRRKPDSSLCVAYNLLQHGRASAVISAGNSGAMMAAGRMIVGLLPGIERPAIAALLPVAGEGRPNVLLDSGANVDCHAPNLAQFAIMGAIYFTSLFGIDRPTVALLSNGSEPSKGNDITRGAASILSTMKNIRFVGYVEGRDVPTNAANVIVCDGFVGNVTLKAMEGCVRLIMEEIRHECAKTLRAKLGLLLAKKALKNVFAERFDYTAHGGAPLLGLRKLAIVLHGSSDSRAVKNAIRVASNFSKSGMIEQIGQALTQLEDTIPFLEGEVLSGVYRKSESLPNEERGDVSREPEIKDSDG